MQSKSELAYRLIRERIESGKYMPGYRLVQAPIAKELNISAVPVREAIRKLEAEGLITFERNIGAQVALVQETEYLHTMQTLALVEGFATAISAPFVAEEQLAKAAEINQQMRQSLSDFDPVRFSELNLEFHSVLFEKCPNPHILDLVHRGWNRMRVLRNSSFSFVPGRAAESVAEHDELLRLIGDGQANQENAERGNAERGNAGRENAERVIEEFAREHRLKTLRAVMNQQK